MAGEHDQTIGPYRLVRRLGRGGFADVWLAERSGPGGFRREVALKLVIAGDAEGDGMRADSLLREARLVSWLDNPAIVAVEAADTQDDIVWMAMEYCDGGSLTALVRRLGHHGLPMPPAVAVRIGRDVARALSAAHHAKTPEGQDLCIVHRDLKPGNVLLTHSGDTKVCDFGIAKATDETNITGTGMLKGTASYVAPELWEDVRAFSPASDAFALGTLLVELISMQRLHAGGAMPLVFRRITEGTGADDAERVRPFLPAVVPLLTELLERNPATRTKDLGAVANRLDDLLRHLPPPAEPGLLLRLLDHHEGRGDPPRELPDRVGQAWHSIFQQILGLDLPLVEGPAGSERGWALATRPAADLSGPFDIATSGFGPEPVPASETALEPDRSAPTPGAGATGFVAPPTRPYRLEPRRSDDPPADHSDHSGQPPAAARDPETPDRAAQGQPAPLVPPASAHLSDKRPTLLRTHGGGRLAGRTLQGRLTTAPGGPPPAPAAVPPEPPPPAPSPSAADDQTLKGARTPPRRRARRRPRRRRIPWVLVALLVLMLALFSVLAVQVMILPDGPRASRQSAPPAVEARRDHPTDGATAELSGALAPRGGAPEDGASSLATDPNRPPNAASSTPEQGELRGTDLRAPSTASTATPEDAPHPTDLASRAPDSAATSAAGSPGRGALAPDPDGTASVGAALEAASTAPRPAAAAPCLLVSSRPAGAYVWIDGAARPTRARSRPGPVAHVTGGPHRVAMSLVEGEAQAETTVTLREGAAMLVACDLLGTARCRVSSAAADLCQP